MWDDDSDEDESSSEVRRPGHRGPLSARAL